MKTSMLIVGTLGGAAAAFGGASVTSSRLQQSRVSAAPQMSTLLDLKGKVAFVAGVGDSTGYGWAICKALAEVCWPAALCRYQWPLRHRRALCCLRARLGTQQKYLSRCCTAHPAAVACHRQAGATVTVGTWPPVLGIFEKSMKQGKFDEDMVLSDGSKMEITSVYPLDAVFDEPDDVPEDVKTNKRYAGLDGFTISECAAKVQADYGKIDILVHSLANGPEVTKPLLETSRRGYLAASSASAYSMVSLVQKFGPFMNPGGSVISLTYSASEKVIPGYGGGMSSAKAQLESDTRTLAWEAGRQYQIRVNTISAGPLKSRAATAISQKGPKPFIEVAIDYCKENAPLNKDLTSDDVGSTAAFLASPMSGAVTGVTMYVDNGMHAMGMVQSVAVDQCK